MLGSDRCGLREIGLELAQRLRGGGVHEIQREVLEKTDFQTIVILKMERQLDMLGEGTGFGAVEALLDPTIASIEAELQR